MFLTRRSSIDYLSDPRQNTSSPPPLTRAEQIRQMGPGERQQLLKDMVQTMPLRDCWELLKEQMQAAPAEERRAFFEDMKGAFADDFEKVANPPARPPLDVVPVYADLGHGKNRRPKPPSTPPAQEP